MTKAGPCILCILQIALVHLGAQAQTLVSGVVQRADGSAVAGAAVAFYPFGPSSGLRPKGVTNDKGEYSLAITYVGPGLLSASRTDEGYPDAAFAFYSLRDDTSAREIDPEGAAIGNVRLRFGRPDPRLELSVRSKAAAVASVQFDVRSLANKDIYSVFSWDPAKT